MSQRKKAPGHIYHILKDGKTFRKIEKVAKALGKGVPGNSSGHNRPLI